MRSCQKYQTRPHLVFLRNKAPTFPSQGFVMSQNCCIFGHCFKDMAKLQFKFYNQAQGDLFPSFLGEKIPETHPVRLLSCR